MNERLEKIKHTLQEAENMVDEFGAVDYSKQDELVLSIFDYGDLDWLIEQVERVQVLEKREEVRKKGAEANSEYYRNIEQQNAHYREALKYYGYECGYVEDDGKLARKELERESK